MGKKLRLIQLINLYIVWKVYTIIPSPSFPSSKYDSSKKSHNRTGQADINNLSRPNPCRFILFSVLEPFVYNFAPRYEKRIPPRMWGMEGGSVGPSAITTIDSLKSTMLRTIPAQHSFFFATVYVYTYLSICFVIAFYSLILSYN